MVAIVTVVMAFATAGSSAFLLLIMEAFPPRVRHRARDDLQLRRDDLRRLRAVQRHVAAASHRRPDVARLVRARVRRRQHDRAVALPRAPGRFASRRPLSGAPLHSRRRRTPAAPPQSDNRIRDVDACAGRPARLRFARRRSRHHETNVRNSTLMAACCAATCMGRAGPRQRTDLRRARQLPAIRAHRQPDERRPDERRCIDVALRLHRQRGSRRRPARELPPRKRLRPDVRPPAKRGIVLQPRSQRGDRLRGLGTIKLGKQYPAIVPEAADPFYLVGQLSPFASTALIGSDLGAVPPLPGRIENAISYKTATYGPTLRCSTRSATRQARRSPATQVPSPISRVAR